MTTVAFPSDYIAARSTTIKNMPSEAVDILTDGTTRVRTLTTTKYAQINWKSEPLYSDEMTVLDAFLIANSANTITMTLDGKDYSGNIIGGHDVSMSGGIFYISFLYYAEIL